MTGYNPNLAIMRAAAKARPCPWCYAEPGQPCRAFRGKGDELNKFVHPLRMTRTPPDDRPDQSDHA